MSYERENSQKPTQRAGHPAFLPHLASAIAWSLPTIRRTVSGTQSPWWLTPVLSRRVETQ